MTRIGAGAAGVCAIAWAVLLWAGEPNKAPDLSKLPPAAVGQVEFERDIAPLLEKRCQQCHGAVKESAGLRLDDGTAALKGGNAGAVIKPGDSQASVLIHLVAGLDPDPARRMPPKGKALTAEEIGKLRAWIDRGAKWPKAGGAEPATVRPKTDHWAFLPPKPQSPPKVADTGWVRNGIDNFVLAKLEAAGIAPSPEADPITLIRRLSLDLTGLPPQVSEVEGFLADRKADPEGAYRRLVERLLASPHYGERWGRHWLDMARYADSDGFEKDTGRPFAWRWRNWVIDALNRDLPFDRFAVEQLAGDLLPNATTEQKAATGFHRNTLTNKEGGVDQEQFRVEACVDRVNTTAKVFLGVTMGCAQCHDHKYDPFSQKDYYRFFAFFNSDREVDIDAPPAVDAEKERLAKAAFEARKAELEAAVKAYEAELPAKQAAWEAELAKSGPAEVWQVLTPEEFKSAGGATFTKKEDQSLLVSGAAPDTDTYTVVYNPALKGITGLRLEVLADPSLPGTGPGRADNGNFVLTHLKVVMASAGRKARAVILQNATADHSQAGFPVTAAIADTADVKTGWAIAGEGSLTHNRTAVFQTREDLGPSGGLTLTVTLDQRFGGRHTIGRFRLSASNADRTLLGRNVPDGVRRIVALPADKRTGQQKAELAKFHRGLDPKLASLNAQLADFVKTKSPPVTKAQTLAMGPLRKTHVMVRGDFLRPGVEVTAGTPLALPTADAAERPLTRLDLANWIVSPSNPLTARVTANWIWQRYFGRGIVATLEDVGTQGERPSHPELLDWVAGELVARKWSLKGFHRLIATSATYRQSGRARPELRDRDPLNVLLARQNRLRLEAEIIRDVSLDAAGLLVKTVGGPSVRPPQPGGISELTYAGSAKWVESVGPDRYRRGLYTWFQRTSPYPMLMTFDAPDSNVCVVRRERSNTPLQGLTLLNDPVFFECAQGLARRMMDAVAGPPPARIKYGFQLCVTRTPTEAEVATLVGLYDKARSAFAAQPAAAAKLVGNAKPASGVAAEEAAAWIVVARTMLNLDEFVTRE